MDLRSSRILSLALKSLLVSKLQNITFLSEFSPAEKVQTLKELDRTGNKLHQIALKRADLPFQVTYVSAIALQKANLSKEAPITVAQGLAADLSQLIEVSKDVSEELPWDRVFPHFTLEVVPPGWIYFKLNSLGLASWLQALIDQSLQQGEPDSIVGLHKNDNQIFRNSTHFFEIQHTYARCCALLRLGDREGLLSMQAFAMIDASQRSQADPVAVPWLTATKTLRFEQLVEYKLINQVIDVLDYLSDLKQNRTSSQIFKQTYALSQIFQQFYATCRIWGEVKRHDPPLAQARLGLVWVTQIVLRSLLQDFLGVPALSEL